MSSNVLPLIFVINLHIFVTLLTAAAHNGFSLNCYLNILTLGLREIRNKPRHEKTNVVVCDLVRHKPGCTATEDGYRLEISDLERRGIVLSI